MFDVAFRENGYPVFPLKVNSSIQFTLVMQNRGICFILSDCTCFAQLLRTSTAWSFATNYLRSSRYVQSS